MWFIVKIMYNVEQVPDLCTCIICFSVCYIHSSSLRNKISKWILHFITGEQNITDLTLACLGGTSKSSQWLISMYPLARKCGCWARPNYPLWWNHLPLPHLPGAKGGRCFKGYGHRTAVAYNLQFSKMGSTRSQLRSLCMKRSKTMRCLSVRVPSNSVMLTSLSVYKLFLLIFTDYLTWNLSTTETILLISSVLTDQVQMMVITYYYCYYYYLHWFVIFN